MAVNGACRQAKRVDRRQHVRWRAALGTSVGLLLLLAACATPVQVDRADPRVVQRELTSDVISTGNISEPTQIVLHRQDLTERFESDPEGAIVSLHRTITAGKPDPDAPVALSPPSCPPPPGTRHPPPFPPGARSAPPFLFPG